MPYTMEQVRWRHRKRGRDCKRSLFLDEETFRREEWKVHVLFHVERYQSTGKVKHGFALVMMWKHSHAEVRCRKMRDALYAGEISSTEFVNRCTNILHEISQQLIAHGLSTGIPLSFFRSEVTAIRNAEEAIMPAPAVLTTEKFDAICESDTMLVERMYDKIARRFLVTPNE